MLDPNRLPIDASFAYLQELITALELAQRAGALLLDIHQRGPTRIEHKASEHDLLTEADLASQELIVSTIRARFPDHGIVAEEEGGSKEGRSEALWFIDPLDGTMNFAHRLPIFAVSIALFVEGIPTVAAVQDVVRERTYWAAVGQGAWMDLERRLQVSNTETLERSLLTTGFPVSSALNADNNLAEFNYLLPRAWGIRRPGAAALDLAWVADGRFDGYWEANILPWDWAAGVLLVTEAGGEVSGYVNDPWRLGMKQIIASNGRIHQALQTAIQTARRQAGFS